MSDAGEEQSAGTGGEVLAVLSELRASLAALESRAAQEHDRAQAREAVIDRLHAEVERLRAGEVRAILRPAATDLRRLRDDLLTQACSVPETMTGGEVIALLESYADSVALILERCGIVTVKPAKDTRFDPRQQQVTGIAETGDRSLDGLVAAVVGDGYAEADGGRPVAPARVVVYRHAGDGPPGEAAG
jgi:molecular chaperone GrpE